MSEPVEGVLALVKPETQRGFWELPDRRATMVLALVLGVALVAVLSFALSGRAAVLLLDKPSKHFPYPFTIQNGMHLLFFIGLGELFVRWRIGVREMAFIGRRYLPEDEETVLQFSDLGPIRRKVVARVRRRARLPALARST